MQIAIIDLGTNTFHLLIAKVKGRNYSVVMKSKTAVKLGEGAISRNYIAAKPFQRGIDALVKYRKIIDEHKVKKVVAFATSAIRGAENSREFIKTAREQTGLGIKVISGSREAELIYYGVKQCYKFQGERALIIDIGGGSTEFIIADENQIYWKKSFKIGAARLLEMFRLSDPITVRQIDKVEDYLDSQIHPLRNALKKFPVTKLVGSSGSFDTFAEMISFRSDKKNLIKKVNTWKFNVDDFFKLHHLLMKSTAAKRSKMKGLAKMRVDMIVIASICTNYILRNFDIREMHLSKYALKEGALWSILNDNKRKSEIYI